MKKKNFLIKIFIDLDISRIIHRPRQPCCACDEAKFQLTFQGLWSKQTHPKDWPPGKNFSRKIKTISSIFFFVEHLLHWSDIIGAIHSEEYSCKNT